MTKRSDEEARAARRFYLLESQALAGWNLIAESGNYASRVLGSIEALMPDDHEDEQ